jgi:hypothetical protein
MSLSLKVEILAKKASRTLPFSPGMSVAEALTAIRDRTGEGGMDHGLFLPASESQANSKGKWMRDEKLLQNYDLKNGVCSSLVPSFLLFLTYFIYFLFSRILFTIRKNMVL